MAFRFVEYLEIDGKRILVHITQVSFDESLRCFKIDVHDVERFDFLLCKNDSNEWNVVTQMFPDLIIARLFDPLVTNLDKRIEEENNYLSPN